MEQANFYLMFYFIAGSLSDDKLDPFGGGWGERIFVALRFLCILLICTQFILCMGNRPQGAKRMFTSSMVLYGIIMAYTTFCSCYIVIKSFTGGIGDVGTEIKLGDNIFTNLIVSTGSTIGVYFLMSFLYFDPWHMFTSSLQYFMMLPSYICTLQVYAFCNTHDVSWGTKGDNLQSVDLGAAVATKNGAVELEMPSEQLDIDSGYDEALRNLRDRLEVEEQPITEEQIKEDYYRAVRTYVVVVWMVANAVLAMIVTEVYQINDVGGNGYLKCKSPSNHCRDLEIWMLIRNSYSLVHRCSGTVPYDRFVGIPCDSRYSWLRRRKSQARARAHQGEMDATRLATTTGHGQSGRHPRQTVGYDDDYVSFHVMFVPFFLFTLLRFFPFGVVPCTLRYLCFWPGLARPFFPFSVWVVGWSNDAARLGLGDLGEFVYGFRQDGQTSM